MITSEEHVISHIKNWLFSYKNQQNKKGFVLPITGGIDSSVCGALCLNVRPACPVFFVKMGFKPELENDFENWAKKFNNAKFIVPDHPKINISNVDSKAALISTYILLLSQENDLLSVGSITKSEYSLIKEVVPDFYDCYPIIDLYRSEIVSIGRYLEMPENILGAVSLVEQKIGTTYSELEWLDRENEKVQIINSNSVPSVSKFWGLYSQRQKELIGKIYSLSRQKKYLELSEKKMCKARKTLSGLFD